MKSYGSGALLLLICLLLVCLPGRPPLAQNIDPDGDGSKYTWSENTGWISLTSSNPGNWGVTVSNDSLSGFAWGENTGWINFTPPHGGVSNDGAGNLSGYAWGENTGWISFSCQNMGSCSTLDYGVKIDPDSGEFSGWAWGENTGWINFVPNGKPVKTSWTTSKPDSQSLLVTISPPAAIVAGAQWRVGGGDWNNSGATVSNLAVGQYTVEYKDIVLWVKPPPQKVTIQSNQVTSTNGMYHHYYDFDLDGDVDVADVMMVVVGWNTAVGESGYDEKFDLDRDGDIDIVDVMKVVTAFTG